MSTKSVFCRYRLYLCAIGGLTLLTLLLRTLSLCLAFDAEIGYYTLGAALPIALQVLEVIALIACFALPLLVKRDALPRERAPLSMASLIGTGISALLFAIAAVYLLTQIGSLPAPAVLVVVAVIFLGVGAAYFVLQFLGKTAKAPLCGYGVILAAALLLSITYFDRYTQMNAPHKVASHMCLLSIMLFMLYELRAHVARPMPRALSVTSAICFLFCATVGVSDLIAFIAGIYTDTLYLIVDLLVTGFALYVGSRTVADLMRLAPVTETPCDKESEEDAA